MRRETSPDGVAYVAEADPTVAYEARPDADVRTAVAWYFHHVYGRDEGAGTLPFYCDPKRVGAFAVGPAELAAGDETALFRLFITLSMYQALRDVVIMAQQRRLPTTDVRVVAELEGVERAIAEHNCTALASGSAFRASCDVTKVGADIDCGRLPGVRCHVKEATAVFKRMGDMGKLPTSAWLHLWAKGGLGAVVSEVCEADASPTRRAELLVGRISEVHRVGRKLATLFVSALSTPALARGLTPWHPLLDGNELVVIDTNVARAADLLRAPDAPRTYESRVRWVREQARQLDLRDFRDDLPAYSPRVVQQALYAFCSRSNRAARLDACATLDGTCDGCAPALCPFPRPAVTSVVHSRT